MKADYVAKTAEKRFARLCDGLTETITGVLAQKGWTRQQLSRRTGIAHSTLSNIMNSATRTWNINLLLRVAVALDVKLSDIISAAESADDCSALLLAVGGTEPQSKERLALIIQSVAPAGTSGEMLKVFYSVDMMNAVASSYVSRYLSGELSDRDIYNQLLEVSSSLTGDENLWAKFAEVLSE
jgi:transcriptional regulator with XRE-family HTH domain